MDAQILSKINKMPELTKNPSVVHVNAAAQALMYFGRHSEFPLGNSAVAEEIATKILKRYQPAVADHALRYCLAMPLRTKAKIIPCPSARLISALEAAASYRPEKFLTNKSQLPSLVELLDSWSRWRGKGKEHPVG